MPDGGGIRHDERRAIADHNQITDDGARVREDANGSRDDGGRHQLFRPGEVKLLLGDVDDSPVKTYHVQT